MNPPAPGGILPLLLAGTGIVGGMESSLLYATQALRARGQRVVIAVPQEGPFTALLRAAGHPADDLHVVPMGPHLRLDAVDRCLDLVRRSGVTLIHSHLLPADVLGAAVAHLAGIPCVGSLHGVLHATGQLLLSELHGMPYLCVSYAGRREALRLGFAHHVLQCVETGIDLGRFDPQRYDRAALRARLGVTPERFLVVSVTRLAPEKTPEVLLEVASRLCRGDPRFVVMIAGTGPLEAAVRERLASLPGRESIRLLGSCDDVAELLAAADASLLCSRIEGIPLAVLESMAMGVPVVAHDVGGVREALAGDCGFLVPFGDVWGMHARVHELANDPALCLRLGAAGRVACRARFSAEAAAERLLDAYRAVCAVARAARGEIAAARAAAGETSRAGSCHAS